jgi:pimeloyl-ACP methyl ester carboxylesterase
MTGSKKYAATPFGEIGYSETGSGPAALFVHGIFHNGHLWRRVMAGLTDVRRCIAVDLMTHGDTKITADQDVSFTAQADMLEAFCAALKLDEVDVVANDSASGIVLIFAARHPKRIRSLVLTNGDVHDNWPPPSFERTRKAAAQGALTGAIRQMLKDPDFARTT